MQMVLAWRAAVTDYERSMRPGQVHECLLAIDSPPSQTCPCKHQYLNNALGRGLTSIMDQCYLDHEHELHFPTPILIANHLAFHGAFAACRVLVLGRIFTHQPLQYTWLLFVSYLGNFSRLFRILSSNAFTTSAHLSTSPL